MTTINVGQVIFDAVTGQQVGNLARFGGAVQEVVIGDRVGRLAPGVYNSIISESLVGRSIGSILKLNSIVQESIGGERVGLDLTPQFMGVVMETIGRDSSYKFISTIMEVLSTGDAPIRVVAKHATFSMLVGTHRDTALPSTVKSLQSVPVIFQVAAQQRDDTPPISFEPTLSFIQVVAQTRPATPADEISSMTRMGGHKQIVALSRTIPHIQKSEVVVAIERQIIALHRSADTIPPPDDLRSPIYVRSDIQIVALSKLLAPDQREDYVASHAQVVAQHRDIEATVGAEDVAGSYMVAAHKRNDPYPPDMIHSDIFSAGFTQIVANWRKTYSPASHIDSATLQSITAIERTPIIGYGGELAKTAAQIIALGRADTPPISMESASTLRQVAALGRTVTWAHSPAVATSYVQVAAQARPAAPNPLSMLIVPSYAAIVAQFRDTIIYQGSADVATLRPVYALGRTTPAPGDVYEPGTGVNVQQFALVAAMAFDVQTPEEISRRSRFVRHLATQVAVGDDQFLPQGDVFSDDIAFNVIEQVILAEVFEPSDAPHSTAQANLVVATAVVLDAFDHKDVPQSDATVFSMGGQVVLGDDSYPDPNIPVSELRSTLVAEQIVAGDAQFPDPAIPVSTVKAQLVGAFCAVTDVFPTPTAASSLVKTQIVIEFAILRDNSLMRIPPRENRRRPLISVSIS